MSCNHCTTKFNFFHKEVGCANCGLSFCNKCLKQKCKIPNKGQTEYNVCRTCFLKLTSPSSSTSGLVVVTPPEAYMKRLEVLNNPVAPPITIYKNDSKMQSLRSGLAAQDLQILERLEKLREDRKGPPPSENEIRQRLDTLKGSNNYVVGPSKLAPIIKDSRSDQEKTDALLEQFITERDIELAHNPQEEIEARLASLREQGVRPNEGPFMKNLHDSTSSEDEVENITRKIMDEVALDRRCPVTLNNEIEDAHSNNQNDSPELQWCVLCNNDAQFRCLDCGGDLYCAECSVEAHTNWCDIDHKVVPYKPPK